MYPCETMAPAIYAGKERASRCPYDMWRGKSIYVSL